MGKLSLIAAIAAFALIGCNSESKTSSSSTAVSSSSDAVSSSSDSITVDTNKVDTTAKIDSIKADTTK